VGNAWQLQAAVADFFFPVVEKLSEMRLANLCQPLPTIANIASLWIFLPHYS